MHWENHMLRGVRSSVRRTKDACAMRESWVSASACLMSYHIAAWTAMLGNYPCRRYEAEWAALMVRKSTSPEDMSTTSAVDLAVYSRSRNFRLVWNCKGGK